MDAVLEAHRDVCVIELSLTFGLVIGREVSEAIAILTILSILGGVKFGEDVRGWGVASGLCFVQFMRGMDGIRFGGANHEMFGATSRVSA